MEKLSLVRLASGNIELIVEGETVELAKLIAESMHKDFELCTAICAAIPTALDLLGIDRKKFCEQMLKSQGVKGPYDDQQTGKEPPLSGPTRPEETTQTIRGQEPNNPRDTESTDKEKKPGDQPA